MRILVAHAFYRQAGGEDRYVMRQIDLLRRRHEVRLLAERNEALASDVRTAVKMVYSRAMRQRAEREIREFRPDVIHLHNPYPALGPAVHLAVRQLGSPLVMTVHNHRLRCPNGLMFTEGRMCRRCEDGVYASAVLHGCFADPRQSAAYATALWVHRFALRLHEAVSLFVAPSLFMRDRLVQGGFTQRIVAIANPVDAEEVVSPPGTFGVYIGRLSAEKGVDVLLRALSHAGDRRSGSSATDHCDVRWNASRVSCDSRGPYSWVGWKAMTFIGSSVHRAISRCRRSPKRSVRSPLSKRWRTRAPLSSVRSVR